MTVGSSSTSRTLSGGGSKACSGAEWKMSTTLKPHLQQHPDSLTLIGMCWDQVYFYLRWNQLHLCVCSKLVAYLKKLVPMQPSINSVTSTDPELSKSRSSNKPRALSRLTSMVLKKSRISFICKLPIASQWRIGPRACIYVYICVCEKVLDMNVVESQALPQASSITKAFEVQIHDVGVRVERIELLMFRASLKDY